MLFIILLLIFAIITIACFRSSQKRSSARSGVKLPPVVQYQKLPILNNAIAYAKDPVQLLSSSRKIYGNVFTIKVVNRNITWILDEEFRNFYTRSDDTVLNLYKVWGKIQSNSRRLKLANITLGNGFIWN